MSMTDYRPWANVLTLKSSLLEIIEFVQSIPERRFHQGSVEFMGNCCAVGWINIGLHGTPEYAPFSLRGENYDIDQLLKLHQIDFTDVIIANDKSIRPKVKVLNLLRRQYNKKYP